MQRQIPIIKTCANCKHFKIIKTGMEFKDIVDTSYLISKCRKKNWKIKEYYLQNPQVEIIDNYKVCEFWEEYKPPKVFSIKSLINLLYRRCSDGK